MKVRARLDEIEARIPELMKSGWLRIVIELDKSDPDINRRVRALLPNAVSVDAQFPKEQGSESALTLDTTTPSEVFRQYYRETHGKAATDELVAAFKALREEFETE